MKSTIISLLIGLIIIAGLGFGGYYLYKKFKVSADESSGGNCQLADLNKDGQVNALDLSMITTAISNNSENPNYDLNKDGKVNNDDISVLMKCWTANK